ncbi:MAG TPA: hypothetical protein VHC22_12085 [Pirellulales bacterium]|nr:hypothetical protein [Pirellulales bacterium]
MLTTLRILSFVSLSIVATVVWAEDQPSGDSDSGVGNPAVKDGQPERQPAGKKNKNAAKKNPAPVKQSAENKEAEGAAKPSGNKKAPIKKRAEKKELSASDQEEAAFVFVREHHVDLVELLERLKSTKPKEYQQAVKELYRDSQRLTAVQDRDAEKYELDLRAWQLDSRIRLLTAKLSLSDQPELQEDLKAALADRADVRLAQKELERGRLTARLKKLDEEVSTLTSNRDDELKRTFDRLLRMARKVRPAKAGGKKAAAPAPATDDQP